MTVASVTHEAGWSWIDHDHNRRPFAYLMPLGQPRDVLAIECRNWWSALAVALELARGQSACDFVGGPTA